MLNEDYNTGYKAPRNEDYSTLSLLKILSCRRREVGSWTWSQQSVMPDVNESIHCVLVGTEEVLPDAGVDSVHWRMG